MSDGDTCVARMAFCDVANLMIVGMAFGLMGRELKSIYDSIGSEILRYLPYALIACVTNLVWHVRCRHPGTSTVVTICDGKR